jgi:phage terminase small subunit
VLRLAFFVRSKPTHHRRNERNRSERATPSFDKILATFALCHCGRLAHCTRKRLTTILVDMRVLTGADYIALGNLCQAYSTLMNAQKQMNKTGILYKSKSGYIQQSPLLGIIHTQTTIVNNLRSTQSALSSRHAALFVHSSAAEARKQTPSRAADHPQVPHCG